MNDIIPFIYDKQSVQIVIIGGNPWLSAREITKILDLSNHSEAMSRLDANQKTTIPMQTAGGIQNVGFINESGLYDLIFTSRKPEAKAFRKWVTDVVLPSVRRTGNFSLNGGMSSDWIYRLQNLGGFNHQTHFCVFSEVDYLIGRTFTLAGIRFPDTGNLKQTPRPDISVGKMWANYIKKRSDASQILNECISYQHFTPAITVPARAYPIRLLGDFRLFVLNEWLIGRMPTYFEDRVQALVPHMEQIQNGVQKLLGQMTGNSSPTNM